MFYAQEQLCLGTWGQPFTSSHVYVWDRRFPARISLVNPWTGERKPWLQTMPPDPTGVLYGNFFITPDGKKRTLTASAGFSPHSFFADGLR